MKSYLHLSIKIRFNRLVPDTIRLMVKIERKA